MIRRNIREKSAGSRSQTAGKNVYEPRKFRQPHYPKPECKHAGEGEGNRHYRVLRALQGAFGHGIEAKRSKSGAITIKELAR